MQIAKPRGTKDLFGNELESYKYVVNSCIELATAFGFEEVIIPTFEITDLFHRNNENSDIVKKELYEFKDRGERLISLRPEATASVIRMIGENKLINTNPLPLRYFTYGSMFRYERPQKGRYREFRQFDVEIIGENSIYDVIHVINYGKSVLDKINLLNKTELKINFIGSFDTRKKWIEALKKHLSPYKDKLSKISQERLLSNPLRILDDKIDGKLDFVKRAPKVGEFLLKEEKFKFNEILRILKNLKINYFIDNNLVRGLDYYTDVVFEFVDCDNENQQNAIIAGGQYDGLIKEISDHNLKGIGLAIGLDRCAEMLSSETLDTLLNNKQKRLFFIVLEKELVENYYLKVSHWQNQKIKINYDPNVHKIDKAIKLAQKMNYQFLAIVGMSEFKENKIQIKDLVSRKQETIDDKELKNWWNKLRETY